MKTVMVRYKLKPGRGEENERYVRAVFERLELGRPSGIRYVTFKLDDGLSYVHLARLDDAASNPLTGLDEFRAFTQDIKERCEEAPVSMELSELGSYRVFQG